MRPLASTPEDQPHLPAKPDLGNRQRDELATRERGVQIITVGQYLRPSPKHLAVERYVPPEEFVKLGAMGESLGFLFVASGPLVRSSYHASDAAGR